MALNPYQRLPEGSIRLLMLMPHQDENAAIRCQLFSYAVEDTGGTHLYEALSYVWGSPEKRNSIWIDEFHLPVTANLYAALLRLRDRFITRVLWVDAICINQEDLEERNIQVRSMAKIYAKASRVIVWLGEAVAAESQALEDIRVAAAEATKPNSGTNQNAMKTLLQREWFQRIWVSARTIE
jgi:hypothetical protein